MTAFDFKQVDTRSRQRAELQNGRRPVTSLTTANGGPLSREDVAVARKLVPPTTPPNITAGLSLSLALTRHANHHPRLPILLTNGDLPTPVASSLSSSLHLPLSTPTDHTPISPATLLSLSRLTGHACPFALPLSLPTALPPSPSLTLATTKWLISIAFALSPALSQSQSPNGGSESPREVETEVVSAVDWLLFALSLSFCEHGTVIEYADMAVTLQ